MRRESLPSPGKLSMGIRLQSEMAKAVSAVEIQAASGAGGKSSAAKQLDNFLVAARTAIAGFIDAVAPLVVSRNVGAVNQPGLAPGSIVRVRCDKWLDAAYVPAVMASFTIANPARTVTRIQVDGPDILLTLNTPLASTDAAATVAYSATTATAALGIRDLSGNTLATFAALAITNTMA